MVTRRPPTWIVVEQRRLVRAFRAEAGPSSNSSLQAYLGSPVPVLGVRTARFRSIVAETARRLVGRPPRDARALASALWRGPLFEERAAAIELLRRKPLARDAGTWRLACGWVDSATGWALSDSLASGPIASEVAARPERFAELLSWTRSPNAWRRRASTYALRPWFRSGDLDRPFQLLERLLDDPERWVQRAVGTWLRECWKRDPNRTERFLRREVRRLAPVTITVATERAPKRLRAELRRANRDGRGGRRGY